MSKERTEEYIKTMRSKLLKVKNLEACYKMVNQIDEASHHNLSNNCKTEKKVILSKCDSLLSWLESNQTAQKQLVDNMLRETMEAIKLICAQAREIGADDKKSIVDKCNSTLYWIDKKSATCSKGESVLELRESVGLIRLRCSIIRHEAKTNKSFFVFYASIVLVFVGVFYFSFYYLSK
jgi:hypothetical protein